MAVEDVRDATHNSEGIIMLKKFAVIGASLLILFLGGCDTGDDLSGPAPGQGEVTTWRFTIDGNVVIEEDTTYAVNYWENDQLVETEFYFVDEDTIYFKGYQIPGSQIIADSTVFSPIVPAIDSEWWGPGSNHYTVVDSTDVIVPTGTFPAYIYQISDSTSGTQIGSLVLVNGTGIIAMVQISGEDTTLSIVLDSKSVTGGSGVFPLSLGNQWTLKKGVYEVE